MAVKTFDFADNLTLPELQLHLRNTEGLRRELKKLEALDTGAKKFTLGSFERAGKKMTGLRLVLDPNSTQPPGAGEQLVCRGEAWIQTFKQKIAAFRPT